MPSNDPPFKLFVNIFLRADGCGNLAISSHTPMQTTHPALYIYFRVAALHYEGLSFSARSVPTLRLTASTPSALRTLHATHASRCQTLKVASCQMLGWNFHTLSSIARIYAVGRLKFHIFLGRFTAKSNVKFPSVIYPDS